MPAGMERSLCSALIASTGLSGACLDFSDGAENKRTGHGIFFYRNFLDRLLCDSQGFVLSLERQVDPG